MPVVFARLLLVAWCVFGASKSDIDTAYQRLAADAKGKRKLQLLSQAHAVLSNDTTRKEYDAMRQRGDVRSMTVESDAKSADPRPQKSREPGWVGVNEVLKFTTVLMIVGFAFYIAIDNPLLGCTLILLIILFF